MKPCTAHDPHGNESRPRVTGDSNCDEQPWRCPSCRDVVELAQQFSCGCGYKVCQSCWQIAANFGGACPSCGGSPDAETIRKRVMSSRPASSRGDRSTASSGGSTISRSNTPHQEQQQHQQQQQSVFIRGADRRVLQNLRVIQRTLVYAIGLSPSFAQSSTLKQSEYFGQYGDISKLVINHHQGVSPDDPRFGSASAYITFRRQEDAWSAICSVDGFRLMGRTIRASFGTTKYCNSFLRNLPCNNPECLYLHELGDEEDRFTKDEVQLGLARHGSSFAFKEEVLGDRSGLSSNRGGGPGQGGGRSATPQPANPVLPPPCPLTPPSYDGGVGAAAGANCGVVRGSLEPSPQLSPCTRVTSGEHGAATAGGAGVAPGADGSWVGASPGSPLPLGADGRPRPRRRRGQRGRRGGGGANGGTGSNCVAGANVDNRGVVGGGMKDCDATGNYTQAELFTGSTCNQKEFAPGGPLLAASTLDFNQIGVGVGAGGQQRTSSVAVSPACPVRNECIGRYGQGLTSVSLESAMERATLTGTCSTPAMRKSVSPGAFLLSDRGFAAGSNVDRVDVVGGRKSCVGGGSISSIDLFHPAEKVAAHTWGGSDRSSVSSCRSTGCASSYNDIGRNYWGRERGSPLATPETIISTPPVEQSPSDGASPPSTIPGLGGVNPQRVFNHRGLGDTTVGSWGEEREEEGVRRPGTVGDGMYTHHRHLQLRPAPAFFGLGDGVQQVGPQQLQQHKQQRLHGGSRGGDMVSIAELRPSAQQDRRESFDCDLDQQRQKQRQPPKWQSGGVDLASISGAQQVQQQRQRYMNNNYGDAGPNSGGDSGALLFAQGLQNHTVADGRRISSTAHVQSPLPPPGSNFSGGCRRGSGHSDDLSSCGDHLAALSWDDNGGGAGGSGSGIGASPSPQGGCSAGSSFYGAGAGDAIAGKEAQYQADGKDPWAPLSLPSVDSFATSASQAEASHWRRATPRLFA